MKAALDEIRQLKEENLQLKQQQSASPSRRKADISKRITDNIAESSEQTFVTKGAESTHALCDNW